MKNNIDDQIFLWGAGSQCRIIESFISDLNLGHVKIVFDPLAKKTHYEQDERFFRDLDAIGSFSHIISKFVVCIGNYAGFARVKTSELLCDLGLDPLSVIHDTSWIDESVSLGKGLQIMPRAVVNKFSSIGDWCVVNTAAVIDHECCIGQGVHIMGGAAIAGRVVIEDYASIGTNATILPDVRVGAGAVIGAGAVVTTDVAAGHVVAGVPARYLRTSEQTDPSQLLTDFRSHWQ